MNFENIHKRYKSLPVQVRAAMWFLICGFLQRGISVITTPIFTRLLSTSEYGLFSVFNSWLGIAQVVITLNLSSGVYTQGLVKFESDRDVWSSSMQGLTLTLCSLWTIFYLLRCEFWNSLIGLSTIQMLSLLCMCWCSAVFSFWASEQRVYYNYKTLVLVTVVTSILKPVIGIVFVLYSTDKVTARILGLALVELVSYSWAFFKQVRRGRKIFCSRFWSYALRFNLPLIPHYLSQVVLSSSDRIMIASLVGSSDAGIYNLAYQISQVMGIFNTALLNTLTPWIYRKLHDRRPQDLAKVAYPSFIFIGSANLVLICLAPEAVKIFAPPEYADAIWTIPPVTLSVYLTFGYSFFASFAFYFEKTSYVSIATVSGAVLNIAMNFILLPKYGYLAAAYTTLACYVIFITLHYCFMRRISYHEFGVQPYDVSILLRITISLFASSFIIMSLYEHSFARYTCIVGIAIIIFCNRPKIHSYIKMLLSLKER